MAGNAISGMKKGARDEAKWLHDLVATGKITLDDVLDAIAVPDEAMAVWREASTSDNELASFSERRSHVPQVRRAGVHADSDGTGEAAQAGEDRPTFRQT